MRRTPASSSPTVPQDYVEASGLIVFPEGNPFPRKRLPDLRIQARDLMADPVDRAPYVYAPGLVAGVLQVNVRVPDDVTSGPAVTVVVTVGSASSQSRVTLAVR